MNLYPPFHHIIHLCKMHKQGIFLRSGMHYPLMNDHELTEIWYIDMYLLGSLELLQCNDNIDPQPPNLSFAHP